MKNFLKRAWRAGVAFGILLYLFSREPPSQVFAVMTGVEKHHLVAAALLSLLICLLAGYKLKLLTQKQGFTFSTFEVMEINFATAFYGLFLPGGNITGGIIRLYKLSSHDKRVGEALVALVCDRMAATIALLAVGSFFWCMNMPPQAAIFGAGMIGTLAALICIAVMIRSKGASASRAAEKWLGRFGHAHRVQKISAILNRYNELSTAFIAAVMILAVATHVGGIFLFYTLADAIGMDIDFVALAWIRSAVILATMIPVSVSGLGLREGALVILLAPYGFGAKEALALSLLVFAATNLLYGLAGGILEARRFLLREIRRA